MDTVGDFGAELSDFIEAQSEAESRNTPGSLEGE